MITFFLIFALLMFVNYVSTDDEQREVTYILIGCFSLLWAIAWKVCL